MVVAIPTQKERQRSEGRRDLLRGRGLQEESTAQGSPCRGGLQPLGTDFTSPAETSLTPQCFLAPGADSVLWQVLRDPKPTAEGKERWDSLTKGLLLLQGGRTE